MGDSEIRNSKETEPYGIHYIIPRNIIGCYQPWGRREEGLDDFGHQRSRSCI